MNLGDFIKNYRNEHDLSQRQFASMCGVSNGYISMIEDGKNPRTKEPIVPNISTLKKIAEAMGMPLHSLLTSVDNLHIELSSFGTPALTEADLTEGERMLLELFRRIPEEKQQMALQMLRAALIEK